MVTLGGTRRTLAITRFPSSFVVPLKFFHKTGFITFKNGSKFKLNWSDFLMLRDSYQFWSKYTVEQIDIGLFKLKRGDFEVTGNPYLICSITELTEKYTYAIEVKGDDLYNLKGGQLNFNFLGSSEMLFIVKELHTGFYDCDCRGKTVLDIGAFEGETAVYFSNLGAKKIVLYEPIPDFFQIAKQNAKRNNVNAELHNQGIAEKDGPLTVEFCSKKTACQVKNVTSVIVESGADIAKIDCEGAEESLVNVPDEILQRVSLYMIEIHSAKIREKLFRKFAAAGCCV